MEKLSNMWMLVRGCRLALRHEAPACVPAHNTVVSPGRKGRCPGLENGNGKSGSENSEKAR